MRPAWPRIFSIDADRIRLCIAGDLESVDRGRAGGSLPEEWYEQETIRGDFLREIRRLQMNPDEPLELETYISEVASSRIAGCDRCNWPTKTARGRVLSEAALLGATLLGGDADENEEGQS